MTGNILIVDDTTTDLTLLTDILTKAGYLVHPFDNTEAALAALEKISPELLLTALRLPAPDGLEVCRRIRQDPRLKDIPVIFTGSAADAEGKAEAFDAGGVDYIGKPLQNNEVLSRVQIHLALYHSRQELERAEETFRKSTEGLKIAQAMAHVGHMEFNVNSWAVIWSDET
jgi:PleD family two-component response regulator